VDGSTPSIGWHEGTTNAFAVTWPAAGKVMADAGNMVEFSGSVAPTLPVASVRDTASGGTLSSDKILKSNAVPGNYNDDNLSVGNIRPVAFGLSQTGTLANLAAGDAAYLALEATRNSKTAAAGDIRATKSVTIAGSTTNGSAAIPAASDVRFGVNVDATTGTCKVPAKANVRSGIAVDVSDTGLIAVPNANDVRYNKDVDQTKGTCRVPTAANVRLGVAVDESSEGLIAVPAATDVRSGVAVDQTTGSMAAEAHTANQVLKSAGGNFNDDNLGTGSEGNVKSGTAYGLSKTGTLAGEAHTASQVIESAGGNVHLPTAAQVEKFVGFGPNSETEGTLYGRAAYKARVAVYALASPPITAIARNSGAAGNALRIHWVDTAGGGS
jgi:hypothetical protein